MLQIKPTDRNSPYQSHGWDVFLNGQFICYARTRLGAERAKKEIAKLLPAMPDSRFPVRALTEKEREEADLLAHYEAINGIVTIDKRNAHRPGMNERLICWRLNRSERLEAFRSGVVARIVPSEFESC